MTSKRYQQPQTPFCPLCGESYYLRVDWSGSIMDVMTCDICEKQFAWALYKRMPSQTQRDYQKAYSFIRRCEDELYGRYGFGNNNIPSFIEGSPIWEAARQSSENRHGIRYQYATCHFTQLERVKNGSGYGLTWAKWIKDFITLGVIKEKVYLKWKEKINWDEIPF